MAVVLDRLREGHSEAAIVLRERVRHFGGARQPRSGTWDVVGRRAGPRPADATEVLDRLRGCEETGIRQYENALTDPDIDADGRILIRYRLLPRCRNNVRELGRLGAAADRA